MTDSKTVDGVTYYLVETNDRSFAQSHAYIWRSEDGRLMYPTDEETAHLPQ